MRRDEGSASGQIAAAVVGGMFVVVAALITTGAIGGGDDDPPDTMPPDTMPPDTMPPDTGLSITVPQTTATTSDDDAADGSSDGAEECVITIDSPFAEIKAGPNFDERRVDSAPEGEYQVLEWQESSWAGRAFLWFYIDIGHRQGWIDDGLQLGSKSPACP